MIAHVAGLIVPPIAVLAFQFQTVLTPVTVVRLPVVPVAVTNLLIGGDPLPVAFVCQVVTPGPETARVAHCQKQN